MIGIGSDGDDELSFVISFIFFHLKNLENGYNVIQLETAVGAAIKNFEGALGETKFRYQYGSVKAAFQLRVFHTVRTRT